MDKIMLTRLSVTTLLILFYVVVAALDLSQEVVAPILVIGIALVLFVPMKKKDKKNQQPESAGAGEL